MNNTKINVLFLSSWYPNRVLPTLGNFVQKHAEAVALTANVAALNVCADINCKSRYENSETTLNNVYTVNFYYKKVTHSIPVISQFQKATRYFRAHLKGLKIIEKQFGRIDVVHLSILYPAGIIALYLKKTKHIPFIISEHWTGYLNSKNIKLSLLCKNISKVIARNASLICPVSKDLRDAMINIGLKGNYEIVYNVVDTELFYPQPNKVLKAKIKLLHISTLDDSHKNVSGMLRVTAELSKQRNDFEFWFIGDGDYSAHIKTSLDLGILNSCVFFEGTKTPMEVADIMRNSDCFVLFSNYENLPVVIIEALASGIPIVSSDVGGISEHLTSQFGMLVKPLDEKALLYSLNKIIENIKQNKYNSKELSGYAKDNFSYEKISDKYNSIYCLILGKKMSNDLKFAQ